MEKMSGEMFQIDQDLRGIFWCRSMWRRWWGWNMGRGAPLVPLSPRALRLANWSSPSRACTSTYRSVPLSSLTQGALCCQTPPSHLSNMLSDPRHSSLCDICGESLTGNSMSMLVTCPWELSYSASCLSSRLAVFNSCLSTIHSACWHCSSP